MTGAILLTAWFFLPFLPLVLWAFADRWSFPAVFPTGWGTDGLQTALAQGAVPAFGRSLVLGLLVAAVATPIGAMAARALTCGTVRWPRAVAATHWGFAAFGGMVALAFIAVPPDAKPLLPLLVLLPQLAWLAYVAARARRADLGAW